MMHNPSAPSSLSADIINSLPLWGWDCSLHPPRSRLTLKLKRQPLAVPSTYL
jgi:hypothetical protein